jgi:hypothetical protein
MQTRSRLNRLVGKQGFVKIPLSDAKVTILSVDPPTCYPAEMDDDPMASLLDMGRVIDGSQFTVHDQNGTVIDGSDTGVISGRHISRIRIFLSVRRSTS